MEEKIVAPETVAWSSKFIELIDFLRKISGYYDIFYALSRMAKTGKEEASIADIAFEDLRMRMELLDTSKHLNDIGTIKFDQKKERERIRHAINFLCATSVYDGLHLLGTRTIIVADGKNKGRATVLVKLSPLGKAIAAWMPETIARLGQIVREKGGFRIVKDGTAVKALDADGNELLRE